jgi:hypothetical protein
MSKMQSCVAKAVSAPQLWASRVAHSTTDTGSAVEGDTVRSSGVVLETCEYDLAPALPLSTKAWARRRFIALR